MYFTAGTFTSPVGTFTLLFHKNVSQDIFSFGMGHSMERCWPCPGKVWQFRTHSDHTNPSEFRHLIIVLHHRNFYFTSRNFYFTFSQNVSQDIFSFGMGHSMERCWPCPGKVWPCRDHSDHTNSIMSFSPIFSMVNWGKSKVKVK